MALLVPIPHTFLFSQALPGLTEPLRALDVMARAWDNPNLDPRTDQRIEALWADQSTAARIQVFDDAIGFLRHASETDHAPLIRRLQLRIAALSMQSEPVDDIPLIRAVARALRDVTRRATRPQENDPYLERFRMITRPLDTQKFPGVMLRGPAHLISSRSAGDDLMEEFGKIVALAWKPDIEAARAVFESWTRRRNSAGTREIQNVSRNREDLALKMKSLAEAGFDVHTAPIPWALTCADAASKMPAMEHIGDRPIVHWVVARRHKTPLESWFRNFIDARDASGAHRIARLDVLDRTCVVADAPDIADDLRSLFGRPVSAEDIRQGFAIDVPGYVTQRVEMRRHEASSGVTLLTEIATTKGEMAARLSGWLPPPPPAGKPWIAWGDDLNEHLYGSIDPKSTRRHFSQGIGRRSLTRILTFLHRLGVNALDMKARGHGLFFMPHIGFDFPDNRTRDRVLADFIRYVEENDSNLSVKTRNALNHIRHAWEVCEFQNDRGENLGRRFTEYYARERHASVPLRFSLNGGYEGWKRLFSKQLQMRPDLDPETRETVTDPLLLDRTMKERADALTSTAFPIDLNLPEEVRRRMAELQELAIYLKQKHEAAQSSADHDDMTKLLKRRAFLDNNKALETSLTAQRQGDRINEHWVLMVDIDKFKGINDTYGHAKGDEAIRLVAQILKNCVREDDLACRWGGEEFALVLRHSGREGVEKVAERIRSEVEKQDFRAQGKDDSAPKRHPLTVSIGAAPFRIVPAPRKTSGEFNMYAEEPMDVKNSMTESLDDADKNLYRAKQTGRNRVVYGGEEPFSF